MKTVEEIRQEVEIWAEDSTNIPYNLSYILEGANHILDTYYSPLLSRCEALEASYRELEDRNIQLIDTIEKFVKDRTINFYMEAGKWGVTDERLINDILAKDPLLLSANEAIANAKKLLDEK